MTSQDYRRQKPVPVPRAQISPSGSPRGAAGDSLSTPATGATEFSLTSQQMNDVKAKTVLKEAVDAVVNSFAKHTHGYGRGMQLTCFCIPLISKLILCEAKEKKSLFSENLTDPSILLRT